MLWAKVLELAEAQKLRGSLKAHQGQEHMLTCLSHSLVLLRVQPQALP
jgi:hypothetical protein